MTDLTEGQIVKKIMLIAALCAMILAIAAPAALAATKVGTNQSNTLNGTDAKDTLYGLSGSDDLNGGANRDSLYGGNGDDDLRGSFGNDYLNGGKGQDTIRGGIGSDRIEAADGNQDVVVCGDGVDTATVDDEDVVGDECENEFVVGPL